MSDVIAKNELKNFDGYEFDSYEDRADDEIVDKIEDLIFGKNDKNGSDFLKALWKLRDDMYQDAFKKIKRLLETSLEELLHGELLFLLIADL